jgi:hypothetical protein
MDRIIKLAANWLPAFLEIGDLPIEFSIGGMYIDCNDRTERLVIGRDYEQADLGSWYKGHCRHIIVHIPALGNDWLHSIR